MKRGSPKGAKRREGNGRFRIRRDLRVLRGSVLEAPEIQEYFFAQYFY